MWEWVCIGTLVTGVVAWVVSRTRALGRIFSDYHLLEVAEGLAELKRAALSRTAMETPNADDPRLLQTDAGLALFYTVTLNESGDYVHHGSVSVVGGHTTGAVGQTFCLLWARLLGFPYERLTLSFSDSGVHHAVVILTEAEQSEFVNAPVEIPTPTQIRVLYGEIQTARPGLRWTRSEFQDDMA